MLGKRTRCLPHKVRVWLTSPYCKKQPPFSTRGRCQFLFFEKKAYICIYKMNKEDYITYWRTTALKDWEAVQHLFEKPTISMRSFLLI
jgi:hypothetical protein